VFEHKWHFTKPAQFGQKGFIVQSAQPGASLIEMCREFIAEENVFGVAAFDMGAQLLKALANKPSGGEIALRAAYDVYGVEVDGKETCL